MSAKQSRLFLVKEGEKRQTNKRGKVFTVGAIYTYANRGADGTIPFRPKIA